MQSLFKDVQDFHRKMNVVSDQVQNPSHFLSPDDMEYRLNFLQEELDETAKADANGESLADVFDGLIDLIYVALGTADMMGLPFQEGWDRVHAANMKKELAKSVEESENSTGRGHRLDVIKPEGWVAPDLDDLCIISV